MKTQAEYLEKWYSQVAGMSAVPLPCRETGKENSGAGVSVQIVFLPEGGPYSGPSNCIPGSVLVKGEWSFPSCSGIPKDVRCAPPGNRGTKSITHALDYGFILVWRVCSPCPVLQ